MEALKVIGAILALIVGFALVVGVVIAIGTIGFFLGWALLILFVFCALVYGILGLFKGKPT